MKLKKGDNVIVVSGKDKGKTGTILAVFPDTNQVVIDGVGMVKRHIRKSGPKQSGRIVERPRAIDASNVMFVDPKDKKPTRIGRKTEDGKIVRVTKKSGTTLK
ncbi:MAG TPA: 50S ribosomal protein L24 [Candidatus Paceibacterota bacterium]|nr:50S ribosomal protein L24 [Candidatus Paceibacterota bacterium]